MWECIIFAMFLAIFHDIGLINLGTFFSMFISIHTFLSKVIENIVHFTLDKLNF